MQGIVPRQIMPITKKVTGYLNAEAKKVASLLMVQFFCDAKIKKNG